MGWFPPTVFIKTLCAVHLKTLAFGLQLILKPSSTFNALTVFCILSAYTIISMINILINQVKNSHTHTPRLSLCQTITSPPSLNFLQGSAAPLNPEFGCLPDDCSRSGFSRGQMFPVSGVRKIFQPERPSQQAHPVCPRPNQDLLRGTLQGQTLASKTREY
jgi:hypothetical protein